MHFSSRFAGFVLLVAAPFLVTPGEARAFGEADPTFGATTIRDWSCSPLIAPRADDAAFVVVFSNLSSSTGVAKIKPDGQLDTGWGRDGIALFPSPAFFLRPMLPLPDGGLVAVADNIFRFDPSGVVDASFGAGGRSERLTTKGEFPHSASLQPDGSIVVLAQRTTPGPDRSRLIDSNRVILSTVFTRMTSRGQRDTAFGSGGFLELHLPSDSTVFAWSIGADGSAEVATYRIAANGDVIPGLRRYTVDSPSGASLPAGRLLPGSGLANWLSPIANVDALGHVAVAIGQGPFDAPSGIKVTMFDPNARLDPQFGGSGKAFVPLVGAGDSTIPTFVHPKALWRTSDGGWIVLAASFQHFEAGFSSMTVEDTTRAVRLSANGSLEAAFPQGVDVGGGALVEFARLKSGKLLHTTLPGTGCTISRKLTEEPRIEAVMIEYHDPTLDRYFMTLEGPESVHLDQNVAQIGLRQTGRSFGAWAPAKLPGTKRLCRFFGDDGKAGTSSHFYAPEGAECDGLRAMDAATPRGSPAWRFEGFAASVVDAVNEACPANLTPVYRVYNKGFRKGITSNHRYMTDVRVYEEMVRKDWAPEGVRFCVPP